MKLDIYSQTDVQDPDTGLIKKTWQYSKSIDCHAKSFISNSSTSRSSDSQRFGNIYENNQMLEIRTHNKLNLRQKISNIRDSDGEYIWTELNFPEDSPTVFEVVGTTPITDPFGHTIAFSTIVKRSENQVIGI
jgi:hypothetical protein